MLGFRSDVPARHRRNFLNLFLDITWWGVLNGSLLAFLSIYIARLGATSQQVGLLSAAPAVANLIMAFPAGKWLGMQKTDEAVFKTSVLSRAFYGMLIPLPFFFSDSTQVWVIVLITLVMSIPGTVVAIGFNALFAEAVPIQWRAYVMGVRNATFAVSTIVTSLICGFILQTMPFPGGYQIVFAIGFIGSAMSSFHLRQIHPVAEELPEKTSTLPAVVENDKDLLRNGWLRRMRLFQRELRPRTDLLKGQFGRVIGLFFAFHLAQYLGIPLFPVYQVEFLHLSDQALSLGNAVFYVAVFLGAMQLAALSARLGSQKVTGLGVMLLGAYPVLLSVSINLPLFLFASFMGGAAWSLVSGAMFNYLLERVPAENRPAYLAWYNIVLNAAVLLGSMSGPVLASITGMVTALVLVSVARVVAGFSIFRWG